MRLASQTLEISGKIRISFRKSPGTTDSLPLSPFYSSERIFGFRNVVILKSDPILIFQNRQK
jgi:hypothetical protein